MGENTTSDLHLAIQEINANLKQVMGILAKAEKFHKDFLFMFSFDPRDVEGFYEKLKEFNNMKKSGIKFLDVGIIFPNPACEISIFDISSHISEVGFKTDSISFPRDSTSQLTKWLSERNLIPELIELVANNGKTYSVRYIIENNMVSLEEKPPKILYLEDSMGLRYNVQLDPNSGLYKISKCLNFTMDECNVFLKYSISLKESLLSLYKAISVYMKIVGFGDGQIKAWPKFIMPGSNCEMSKIFNEAMASLSFYHHSLLLEASTIQHNLKYNKVIVPLISCQIDYVNMKEKNGEFSKVEANALRMQYLRMLDIDIAWLVGLDKNAKLSSHCHVAGIRNELVWLVKAVKHYASACQLIRQAIKKIRHI